jgi:hypothetical protein
MKGQDMRVSIRARALALALVAAGCVALPLAAPSGAALTPSVACSKLSSKVVASKATTLLTQCTPAALAAGGVSVIAKTPPPGSQKGTLGVKITWNNGKGTTTMAATFVVQQLRGNCPVGTTRITSKGSVKIVTGAAAKIIKVGEPVTAAVCSYLSGPKAGTTSLAPGTKYKL